MRLVDQLDEDTESLHHVTDDDVARLLGAASAEDYRRYLARMYGFVCPLEAAILNVPDIEHFVDVRMLHKADLLRRDLAACHMSVAEIAGLPRCSIPRLATPEEAIGWAYPVERSTLRHGGLYRHLASILPGEMAFASSYLKCYFSAPGESWRSYLRALESVEYSARPQQVVHAAKEAFHALRAWRFVLDDGRRGGYPMYLAHASRQDAR